MAQSTLFVSLPLGLRDNICQILGVCMDFSTVSVAEIVTIIDYRIGELRGITPLKSYDNPVIAGPEAAALVKSLQLKTELHKLKNKLAAYQ